MAALREPRNIEDAAKAKEVLLRARAAEAAVWVLSDPDFLEDACRLLVGLVKLNAAAAGTEAGFALCRKLRLFVLQLSPAVVAVRCLRGKIGPPEVRECKHFRTVCCTYLHVDVESDPPTTHMILLLVGLFLCLYSTR